MEKMHIALKRTFQYIVYTIFGVIALGIIVSWYGKILNTDLFHNILLIAASLSAGFLLFESFLEDNKRKRLSGVLLLGVVLIAYCFQII